jgi:hypothetical protein
LALSERDWDVFPRVVRKNGTTKVNNKKLTIAFAESRYPADANVQWYLFDIYWARSFVSALARLVRSIDRSSKTSWKFPTADTNKCMRSTTEAIRDVREPWAFKVGDEINGRRTSLVSSTVSSSGGNIDTIGIAATRKMIPSQNGRDNRIVMAAAAIAGLRKPTTEVKAVILLK